MTGALARRGLDYDSVRETSRRRCTARSPASASAGGADLPGYDFLVQAMGGLMSITGDASGEPTKVGVALVDVLTAKDATIGVLAALAARHRTGEGQRVEVNLLSSLLGSWRTRPPPTSPQDTPVADGQRAPSIAPYETLRCADDLIAVAVGNDGQFRKLTGVLEAAALADDPDFATNAARVANRPALVARLESRL